MCQNSNLMSLQYFFYYIGEYQIIAHLLLIQSALSLEEENKLIKMKAFGVYRPMLPMY